MKNTKEQILEITQAFLDGKEIEVNMGDNSWGLIESRFDWGRYEYRVKPKLEGVTHGGWTFLYQPNYGIALYYADSHQFVANMSWGTYRKLREFAESLPIHGIIQDTSQFNGVDPCYREYKEPTLSKQYNMDDVGGRLCEAAFKHGHKAGWDAYQQALEEE